MAPSPVWDSTLHRQALVDYAMDARVAYDGTELAVLGEPLIAADPSGSLRQSVRLQWMDGRAFDPAQPVTITVDGTTVDHRADVVHDASVRYLVPEVSAPTPARIRLDDLDLAVDVTLTPQRHWQIHLVHHSHLDIGYTDPQHLVREQHLGYLDSVLQLARDTDGLSEDAKFRWSEEALFSVVDWLDSRPVADQEAFVALVKQGRISLSAMPFNLHTEMCSTDELHELLRPALELKNRFGLDFDVAMQTDVPGQVVGLPDALAGLGVKFLSVAHNWAGRSDPDHTGELTLPRLFRWEGPEGGAVVVWRTDTPHGLAYMEGPTVGFHEDYATVADLFPAYLSSLGKRPYPMAPGSVMGWLDRTEADREPYPHDVLHLRVLGRWSDNAGPSRSASDVVEEWNARWAFPHLRVSTNEDFYADAVERIGELETHTGDWNDWWAHGVGAAAAPVALGRRAQSELADAQTLAVAARWLGASVPEDSALVDPTDGYAQLALWDEHTWGAADSWRDADEGHTSGTSQWYWKVARAYEALDHARLGLHTANAALASHLVAAADRAASLYVFNASGALRSGGVRVFVPASTVALDDVIEVTDARTGAVLPYDVRTEESGARALGRYLRIWVTDVPAVGYVRLDLAVSTTPDSAAGWVADPTSTVLENDHLRVELDLSRSAVASIVDKSRDLELVNTGAAVGFNAYVYDRYATAGHLNHNSSKFADAGNLALLSERSVAGPAAVVESVVTAYERRVVTESRVDGARWLRTTYSLPHASSRLDITNRLSKASTSEKESAFFAFPFATASSSPVVLQESAGGLSGPGAARVPGGAQYMTAIRHWVSIADGERAVAWATADAPLVEVGHLALPYVPFPNTMTVDEPATIYSWVHNNIWDTNFPVEQSFETDFRYSVTAGDGDAPSLAAATASALVQPLRPVLTQRQDGSRPQESAGLVEIDDPRVRLVGLTEHTAGAVVVRLQSVAPEGVTTTVRFPTGIRAVEECTYLGVPVGPAALDGDTVTLTFRGAGARALLVTI